MKFSIFLIELSNGFKKCNICAIMHKLPLYEGYLPRTDRLLPTNTIQKKLRLTCAIPQNHIYDADNIKCIDPTITITVGSV